MNRFIDNDKSLVQFFLDKLFSNYKVYKKRKYERYLNRLNAKR
jgi:hypothetical protein